MRGRPARERVVSVVFLPATNCAAKMVALQDDNAARLYLKRRYGMCKLRVHELRAESVIYRVNRASDNEFVGHMLYVNVSP